MCLLVPIEPLAIMTTFLCDWIGHTQAKAGVVRATIAVYKTTAKVITITKRSCSEE